MWRVYYVENTYNLIKQWTTTYLLKRHSYHCFLPWWPKAQVITSGRNHNQTNLFIDKTTSPITRWRVEYRQAITRFLYFVLVTTLQNTQGNVWTAIYKSHIIQLVNRHPLMCNFEFLIVFHSVSKFKTDKMEENIRDQKLMSNKLTPVLKFKVLPKMNH